MFPRGEKFPNLKDIFFSLRFFWNIFEKLFSYVLKTQADFFVCLFVFKCEASFILDLTPNPKCLELDGKCLEGCQRLETICVCMHVCVCMCMCVYVCL